MIQSMTGYSQVVINTEHASIVIEVKSLNSKFLDLSLRVPKKFADKENEIRNLVNERLERGKISFSLDYQPRAAASLASRYDEEVFVAAYTELKKLADRVMAGYDTLFGLALSASMSPAAVVETADPEEWKVILSGITEAIAKCSAFRAEEGNSLAHVLKEYITNISKGLQQVEELDAPRIARIRAKLTDSVTSFFGAEGFDVNRLEQEMIFYVEKLDIQEERVRLKTHLEYFLTVLKEQKSNGKKLGFIAQEIGREINTIGSKANDAAIQKSVVEMKDELEKIKEQLNNVL